MIQQFGGDWSDSRHRAEIVDRSRMTIKKRLDLLVGDGVSIIGRAVHVASYAIPSAALGNIT
jgi:hypothetical protein